MQYVLIIHEVENYAEWKKGFDKASTIRKEAGELSYQVLSYKNDPNKIIHYSQWISHEKAQALLEAEKRIALRKELGVKEPDFIYANQIEQGIL